MAPAVLIGAAAEKFLKFDSFLCIFKAFFRFPFPVRGELFPEFPPGYAYLKRVRVCACHFVIHFS